jgi:predicted TIM-barrel fold metal-dependent hydrolase
MSEAVEAALDPPATRARRHFLGQAAAAVGWAAAASVAKPSRAQAAAEAGSTAPRILVDWHSHFVSRAETTALRARKEPPNLVDGGDRLQNVDTASAAAGAPMPFEVSDIAARLRHLDANRIQRQLLTHTVALGLDASLPVAQLRPLFRAFNDELAQVVHSHPDRFLAVAAIPTADPQWAATELERAHRELGFIGASLPLNAFSTLAGAQTLAPVFAAGQRHASHFFIHRGPASSTVPGQPATVLPQDTEYARWSLISNTHLAAGAITLGLTDFLDPYPDVSVQVIMLAGFLPYLIDAVVPAARRAGVTDPTARLRRLHVDPGPYSRNAAWVRYAIARLGADRILFGSDYGVGGGARGEIGDEIKTLDAELSADERRQIYVENSRRLLASKGIAV